MDLILIISFLISFLITLAVLPKWIKKSQEIGLLWEDMNKWGHPKNVASSGGVIVVLGFVLGVLAYIAMRTFIINDSNGINLQIFALLSVILILAIVGLVDDLLGWRQGGLSVKFRLFLLLFASIPLVVINAGQSEVMGFNLGLFYPLILIPLGIMGATATYNFLAGYNGLE
ncbi:glycosyl transferase family 4, partial [Candidatus Pacearchaeota archaeon]|nr:glycosyl transferase family 4 [Candidatus Pacearchaeota archaeon]